MNKVYVVGLGPGHRDYILPIALKVINNSEVIIGGKRHLESIDTESKETYILDGRLESFIDFIKQNYNEKKIAVVVSGDTGFYSLLKYIKRNLNKEIIEVIPGISSMQYMFSKLGESWDDAYIGSLHGREENFIEKIKKYKKVGLLTDKKWTPSSIANELVKNNLSDRTIYVGENLSYEDEKIYKFKENDIKENAPYKMSVVVIINE